MTAGFRVCIVYLGVLACVLGAWAPAHAQSGIGGVVRDTTGAVLPGVTVEASSPVLIEKVRVALTDDQGLYRIDDLRPGTYLVTFTLPGFSTVRREGIQLQASFTATVNVTLSVGAIEESVTVTGEAPTVDVRSVVSQQLFSREVVEALPALRSPHQFAALAPAVTSVTLQDALGSNKDQFNIAAYGGRIGEAISMVDGVSTQNRVGGGSGGQNMRINQAYVQEVNVVLESGSAEQIFGGVVMNVIPKEGGNQPAVEGYADVAPGGMQSDNLTDELRAQGAPNVSEIIEQWDANVAFGGPILRDRAWTFLSYRNSIINQTIAGTFKSQNYRSWTYQPDRSTPAENKVQNENLSARLTWQVTPKHKVAAFIDHQPQIVYNRAIEFGHSPEGTTFTPYEPNSLVAGTWKVPMSSRLLIENRASYGYTTFHARPQSYIAPDTISALETTTGMMLRANSTLGSGAISYGTSRFRNFGYTPTVSYVTGSHNVKAGAQIGRATTGGMTTVQGNIAVSLRNGVPISLTQYATPFTTPRESRTIGLFVQDQWTVRRLTLNLGLRYDTFDGRVPADRQEAVQFAPARDFAAEQGVPDYKDLNARVGVAYDLFGDSRTALKVSLNRFVTTVGVSPQQSFVASVTRTLNMTGRTWTDAEGSFFPNCDLTNPNANGACGAISNRNFGLSVPNATTSDPDVLAGFGVRPFNWTSSVSIQHELMSWLSLTAGYHRRWYGNFRVTQNELTTPADYDPYCVTAPVDSRLPNGGGYQVCGLTNVNPSRFGQVRNRVRMADNFGDQYERYNGVDVSFTARLPRGVQVAGGTNTGRSETDRCFVVNSAQDLFQCNVKPPFATNVKLYAVVPLAWDITVSPVYQRLAPLQGQYVTGGITNFQVTSVFTNAQIAPSLGRNLSQGAAGTVTIPIVAPGEVFNDASQQLNLRLSKAFRTGRARISGALDIYNVFNSSAVQRANYTYGPLFLTPQVIQAARYMKLSTSVEF
ncbi:MAG: TonB-dependent receptor [Acidimicrobiia bacterium]|nr:TonB-dependent receptor [Acidimicrobiia bacterium]